jgi:maltose alpha-D-glucosyltransferase / alpha-amylase
MPTRGEMSPDAVAAATRTFQGLWSRLYPNEHVHRDALVETLLKMREQLPADPGPRFDPGGLVYCTYGDAFFTGQDNSPPPGQASPLDGLAEQMDRLKWLGVSTLWILPLLRSPGRDQGFDVSDYGEVDPHFGGNPAFQRLLNRARDAGILVMFDVAINHTSNAHPWFRSACADPASPCRSWYHWSDTDTRFSGVLPVFKGMVDSCWTWSEEAGQYYFHRFYDFQPDLNYAEPAVTAAMIRVLASWTRAGVSGFRLDAAPMLWKAEGTSCESLPETHLVIRIFRAALEMLGRGSVLLAEANMPADALREYFGAGDECHAAFHFPLLPLLWKSLRREDPRILVTAKFPALPPGCSWVTFLRCHDEVALDLLPQAEREDLLAFLCREPSWVFRGGKGVSGRLFELLGRDPDWTILAFSILLSLPGTPVLYYGDEVASTNNEQFYREKSRDTGYPDSRFIHRGPFDAERARRAGVDSSSPEGRVLAGLRRMVELRSRAGDIAAFEPSLSFDGPVLVSERRAAGRVLRAVSNLSARRASARGQSLGPHECRWELV